MAEQVNELQLLMTLLVMCLWCAQYGDVNKPLESFAKAFIVGIFWPVSIVIYAVFS
jgi:hypothetical protein